MLVGALVVRVLLLGADRFSFVDARLGSRWGRIHESGAGLGRAPSVKTASIVHALKMVDIVVRLYRTDIEVFDYSFES